MAITMVATLISFLIVIINPFKQLEKAKDARKQHDLLQIRNALDLYYNDTSSYPISLPFGNEWKQNDTIYMKKVPQDPDCDSSGYCYVYTSGGSWNVLFAKLSSVSNLATKCPLEQLTSCLPLNYQSFGYNDCVISGQVDCQVVATTSLPAPLVSPTPTPTSILPSQVPTPILTLSPTPGGPTSTPVPTATLAPTPTPTPTPVPTPTVSPTPTPVPCPQEDKNYSCRGSPPRCNIVSSGTGTFCNSNCNGVCP